jgi:hypothetical protein
MNFQQTQHQKESFPGEASTMLETVNPYESLHKDFNNSRLFKRLKEKHRPKPFWQQHRKLYYAVTGVSYIFNVLSAFTASALVFMFIMGMTNSATISAAITAIALIALEYMKRETSGKLFAGWLQYKAASPGMIATVICLSLVSTAASYFGAESTVMQFTRPVQLMDVSDQVAPLEGQIAEIDNQIRAAAQSTWQGRMTQRAQRTVDRLTQSRAALTDELIRARQRADEQNDATQYEYEEETTTKAEAFAAFTAVSEIALIVCLWFMAYYDYRSFAEYAHVSAKANSGHFTGFKAQGSTNANRAFEGSHANGVNESEFRQIGFKNYGVNYNVDATQTDSLTTDGDTPAISIVNEANEKSSLLRSCKQCGERYVYGHNRQMYCCDACRIVAWKNRQSSVESA